MSRRRAVSILYYKATRGYTDVQTSMNTDMYYCGIYIHRKWVGISGIATGRNTSTQIKALDLNLSGKGLRIEHVTTGFKRMAVVCLKCTRSLFWTSV